MCIEYEAERETCMYAHIVQNTYNGNGGAGGSPASVSNAHPSTRSPRPDHAGCAGPLAAHPAKLGRGSKEGPCAAPWTRRRTFAAESVCAQLGY